MGRESVRRFQIHGRLTFPIGLRRADPDMSYPTRGMTEDRSSPLDGRFSHESSIAGEELLIGAKVRSASFSGMAAFHTCIGDDQNRLESRFCRVWSEKQTWHAPCSFIRRVSR